MSKIQSEQGFTPVEMVIALVVLIAIGVTAYFIAKNMNTGIPASTPTYTSTVFNYDGHQFPVLTNAYILIAKVPSVDGNGDANGPGVEYLTKDTTSQIESYLNSVCKAHNFSQYGGGTATPSWSSGGKQYSYTSTLYDCENTKVSWAFNIANANALVLPGVSPHVVIPNSYKKSLSLYNWVEVSSGVSAANISSGSASNH